VQVSHSTTTDTASLIIAPSRLQSQGNTVDDHLELEFEPDQDEMNAVDEAEERIQDIENLFDQRQSESMAFNTSIIGTEGEDVAQERIGAKEEEKDVQCIDVAGEVKEGDANNQEEAS
jgi:hypothetical protein